MAAAALLALTVGLHVLAASSSVPDEDHLDERRIGRPPERRDLGIRIPLISDTLTSRSTP